MEFIRGYTFGFMAHRGDFLKLEAKESLDEMIASTNCDTVMLAVTAWQDTPQSIIVDYLGNDCVSYDETREMIKYIKSCGKKVILKPMVNCRNGTWRAFIDFFDIDVVCEPSWSQWFKSYNEYILLYAKLAEETNSEMLCIGCELVKAQRMDSYWRKLVSETRKIYNGLITYNTDKYQEENVTWWDAVDVISSSGYYPVNDWDRQLKRIKKTVDKYNKPFFFAECGTMSTKDSFYVPNDWNVKGDLSLEEQAEFFKVMFEESKKTDFVDGFAIWDWSTFLSSNYNANEDKGYSVYKKPAQNVIHEFYTNGFIK